MSALVPRSTIFFTLQGARHTRLSTALPPTSCPTVNTPLASKGAKEALPHPTLQPPSLCFVGCAALRGRSGDSFREGERFPHATRAPLIPARSLERGAALPVLALLAFALIAVMAVLGIDTTRVKSEGALLRRRVESMCRATARVALVPERAITVFRSHTSGLQLTRGTKISSVRLTLPFALNADTSELTFDTSARDTCQATQSGVTSYRPPVNGEASDSSIFEIPFGSLGGSSNGTSSLAEFQCHNHLFFKNDSVDCVLIPSICAASNEGPRPHPSFPPSMWSDILNAGNTVGCEIEAEVPRLLSFLPPRTISAKAAWWLPLKTTEPYLEDPNPEDSIPTFADFAGLSIGVGTELTTWGGALPDGTTTIGDERFRFGQFAGGGTDSAVVVNLDPRRPIPPGYIRRRFDMENPQRTFTSDFRLPALPPIANTDGNSPAQHELLTACFNPLVLARNLLVSTLVDYASRSGQTRNMTEISHINPRHQAPADDPPLNRPVVLVPFGADLLSPRYQAPFVTYNSGGSFEKGGFIVPWENFGGNSARTQHHNLIAQQLRACYHLFVDNDATSTILRIAPPLSVGFLTLIPTPMRFTTFNLHTDGIPTYWDYGAPWPSNATAGNGRLLTAPELIYSLGSTQSCPIDKTTLNDQTDWPSLNCSKAGLDTFADLRPDIAGYLEYQLHGGSNAYPMPGLSQPIKDGKVIKPEQGGEEQPDLADPQKITTSANTVMPRSTVVMVVHKPIAPSEIAPIKTRVLTLNEAGRPVILIFMPATHVESELFSNFCNALDLKEDCANDGNPSLNSFLFLSPFNSAYGQRYTHDPVTGDPRPEAEVFADYWKDLILNDTELVDDPYYLDIARAVFVDTILKLEPKL